MSVRPITRQDAEASLASGLPDSICDALVRIAFHDPDWRWAQDKCLEMSEHTDPEIAGLAVTCLGHIARIHRQLDLDRALPALRKHLSDPRIAGRAQDALSDIEMFLNV